MLRLLAVVGFASGGRGTMPGMGSPGCIGVRTGGTVTIAYDHWLGPLLPAVLLPGPGYALRRAADAVAVDDWLATASSHGDALIDEDEQTLLFWGETRPLDDPAYRAALLRLLSVTWPFWRVQWCTEATLGVIDHLGLPRSRYLAAGTGNGALWPRPGAVLRDSDRVGLVSMRRGGVFRHRLSTGDWRDLGCGPGECVRGLNPGQPTYASDRFPVFGALVDVDARTLTVWSTRPAPGMLNVLSPVWPGWRVTFTGDDASWHEALVGDQLTGYVPGRTLHPYDRVLLDTGVEVTRPWDPGEQLARAQAASPDGAAADTDPREEARAVVVWLWDDLLDRPFPYGPERGPGTLADLARLGTQPTDPGPWLDRVQRCSASVSDRAVVMDLVTNVTAARGGDVAVTAGIGPGGDLAVVWVAAADEDLAYAADGPPGAGRFPRPGADRPYPVRVTVIDPSGQLRHVIEIPEMLLANLHVQPMPDAGVLLVGSRADHDPAIGWSHNAILYDADGAPVASGSFGDGVRHVQATSDGRVWVGYFDEGVFASRGTWRTPSYVPAIGRSGLCRFGPDLAREWEYTPPDDHRGRDFDIVDCYALNVDDDQVWACYYQDFPLARVHADRVTVWPKATFGVSALVPAGDDLVAVVGGYRPYRDRVDVVYVSGPYAVTLARGWLLAPDRTDPLPHGPVWHGRGRYLHALTDRQWWRVDSDRLTRWAT